MCIRDRLQVSLKDTETVVSAGEVQYAREHPMEEARIRQQMEKLGNTEFVWDSLDIQSDGNIFVPVKVLNELRRTALAQLEQEFLEKYKREAPEKILRGEEAKIQPGVRSEDPLGIYASCETDVYKRKHLRVGFIPMRARNCPKTVRLKSIFQKERWFIRCLSILELRLFPV